MRARSAAPAIHRRRSMPCPISPSTDWVVVTVKPARPPRLYERVVPTSGRPAKARVMTPYMRLHLMALRWIGPATAVEHWPLHLLTYPEIAAQLALGLSSGTVNPIPDRWPEANAEDSARNAQARRDPPSPDANRGIALVCASPRCGSRKRNACANGLAEHQDLHIFGEPDRPAAATGALAGVAIPRPSQARGGAESASEAHLHAACSSKSQRHSAAGWKTMWEAG